MVERLRAWNRAKIAVGLSHAPVPDWKRFCCPLEYIVETTLLSCNLYCPIVPRRETPSQPKAT